MTKVVFVFGLPGSGKSYFASRLAQKINAQYVNSDKIRKERFEVRTYSADEKQAVYDAMFAILKTALENKKDVVLDATFHTEENRKLFTEFVKANAHIFFIEITADEEIIYQRLKKPRPYSEADFEVHQLIKKHFEPMRENHLTLKSTNNNIDEMLSIALRYINKNHDT